MFLPDDPWFCMIVLQKKPAEMKNVCYILDLIPQWYCIRYTYIYTIDLDHIHWFVYLLPVILYQIYIIIYIPVIWIISDIHWFVYLLYLLAVILHQISEDMAFYMPWSPRRMQCTKWHWPPSDSWWMCLGEVSRQRLMVWCLAYVISVWFCHMFGYILIYSYIYN